MKKDRDTVGCAAEGIPPKGPSRGAATPIKRLLGILGPGFITGASDDDPSGIGTYSVAGATLGFAILWTAWVTFPMMAAVQFICAKISMVSGQGLAGLIRDHFPRWVLYMAVFGLLTANTVNAGADIAAVAAALNMFVPLPITLIIIPITGIMLVVQVFGAYRQVARILKWLTLSLFTYIGAAFLSKPDWWAVLQGTLFPSIHFDSRFLVTLVAILGTTISPYLFFWQGSMEVEEEVSMGRTTLEQRQGATDAELADAAVDVNVGMAFSNLVMYFIILATAATLFKSGHTDIRSATDAAQALRPLAGEAARALFALGLVGTGFLAVPILTCSASYAVSEALGWRYGLNQKPLRAKRFYALIILSTLVGVLIDFLGINPIDALVWTAVINGLLAPPLLVILMLIANNRHIMGDRANGLGLNVLGWGTTLAMFGAAVGLFLTWGK